MYSCDVKILWCAGHVAKSNCQPSSQPRGLVVNLAAVSYWAWAGRKLNSNVSTCYQHPRTLQYTYPLPKEMTLSQPDGHGNRLRSSFFWQRVCILQCSRMLINVDNKFIISQGNFKTVTQVPECDHTHLIFVQVDLAVTITSITENCSTSSC